MKIGANLLGNAISQKTRMSCKRGDFKQLFLQRWRRKVLSYPAYFREACGAVIWRIVISWSAWYPSEYILQIFSELLRIQLLNLIRFYLTMFRLCPFNTDVSFSQQELSYFAYLLVSSFHVP